MTAAGGAAEASLRVDALHNGCLTLGLWQAAAGLDGARRGVFDCAAIDRALAAVQETLLRQGARARNAAGAVPVRA